MNRPDDPDRQIELLRARFSDLSAAILRISTSLDLGTVLQEAVDSARALTGARYGGITTVNETGAPDDFVTSGVTAEEKWKMVNWQPDGLRLFEHLRGLREPLRLTDLPDYVRSLGFSSDFVLGNSYLGAPMRNRDAHVGNFFVSEKEGAEAFTDEDEEILLLFAAQAAAAIANARTHDRERRARADLEAVVNASPVGVVVYDVRTGTAKSVNDEARQLVERLVLPGPFPEATLDAVTIRRADGSEWAYGAQLPNPGQAVHGEEIEISVPDGRRVSVLVNSKPIEDADGNVESVVVTCQDLAQIEEVERARAEFLNLVSHELRAPLSAIKGSAATVLGAARVVEPAEVRQFFRIIDDQADRMDVLVSDLLDAGRLETGTLSVTPTPSFLADLVDDARTVFLRSHGQRSVLLDLPPDLPPVMADGPRIVQVLNNLLANAARHSPESSPITVAAERADVHVAVSVADDGEGVAPERLAMLFRKQPENQRQFRGSGLGLLICKGLVEAHGGRIRAESDGPGMGTRIVFTLPVADGAGASRVPGAFRQEQDNMRGIPILVVDDDPEMLRHMRHTLVEAGFAPQLTGDPGEVQNLVKAKRPQLVLLDLMLRGIDGIELMQTVPELGDLPVIFISGYGRDETIARALNAGAVDYIVKPFSPTELTARITAALRRRISPEKFVLGDLVIDYEARRVSVAGKPVRLTAMEYELLRLLSTNAGRVVTRESLLRQLWRGREPSDPDPARAFVRKLRSKLGDSASKPVWIFNERGVGYRMPKPDGA